MKQITINDVVTKVINACQHKNGVLFADCFINEAEMILSNGDYVKGKKAIYQITEKYFAELESIKISVEKIEIQAQKILIKWHWQHCYLKDKTTRSNHNLIILELNENYLIKKWQEQKFANIK